jgi:hypothetical protein
MISQYFIFMSSVAKVEKNLLVELYCFCGVGEATSFWNGSAMPPFAAAPG